MIRFQLIDETMDFQPKQIKEFKEFPHITYKIFSVDYELHEDIYYIWNLKSTKKVEHFSYLIIPDTCIDIILEEKDDVFHSPAVSKPFSKPTSISLSGKFNYWGIRFKPGKIMKYLWFDLKEISDDFKDISVGQKDFNSINEFLELFYALSPHQFDPTFLRFAYDPHQILQSALSSKQKSRLFEQLTGFKINTYKKIQKLHASLHDPYQHFYDQSHYIKTFKDLTADTPHLFSNKYSI